jgi:uncharacterized membrane protein (UPF0127 family)
LVSAARAVAVAAIALIAVLLIYTVYESTNGPGSVTTAVPTGFTVNARSFNFTYLATTQQQRTEGLMHKSVTNSTTELFAFPSSGQWQFWMYDTNTSLDMIWVNAVGDSGRVVFVVTGAQPCYDSSACEVYTPTAPANYVIEAKAGFAAANGISVGTTIQFS